MTMKRALALSSTCLAAASVCPVSAFSSSSSHHGSAFVPQGAIMTSRHLSAPNAALPGRRKRSLSLSASVFNNNDDGRFPASAKVPKDAPNSKTLLSAAAFDALEADSDSKPRGFASDYADVASAALLITGNTVGASMMVLPSVAAGPGALPSAGLFLALYGVNLISGLLLAEVAIAQRESTGADGPSSLKEFAAHNLGSESVSKCVAAVSVFVNSCILAFDISRAGELASARLPDELLGGIGPGACTAAMAAALVGLVSTQTDRNLSRFASATVTVLFASFAGFLLPGLAAVHDPSSVLLTQGTSTSSLAESLSTVAPVFLTTIVYQNIVPSVTKLLDYDRSRVTLAVAVGSALPLAMYLAFCFAVMGGGLDVTTSGGGPLFAAFAAASLTGSSVASLMSLAEEYGKSLPSFGSSDNNSNNKDASNQQVSEKKTKSTKDEGDVASMPSVVLAGLLPLAAGLAMANGGDATSALSTAGSYGSPLLYGVLPAAMAWNQRNKRQDGYTGRRQSGSNDEDRLVPGGDFSLALLGGGAVAFVAQNLERDVGGMLAAAAGLS